MEVKLKKKPKLSKIRRNGCKTEFRKARLIAIEIRGLVLRLLLPTFYVFPMQIPIYVVALLNNDPLWESACMILCK